MPRKLVTLVLAGVCLLATARPAHAERGLWEWLERLSGPGPFWGVAGEVPVVCRVVKVTKKVSGAQVTTDSKFDHTWRCWASSTFTKGAHPERVLSESKTDGSSFW